MSREARGRRQEGVDIVQFQDFNFPVRGRFPLRFGRQSHGLYKCVWSYFCSLRGRTALNGRRSVGVFNGRVWSVHLMREIRQGFLWVELQPSKLRQRGPDGDRR